MKKSILTFLFIAAPFLSFSQEKSKEPIVKRNQAGIIQSVEFPDSIPFSKLPSSANDFFKDFLKSSLTDEFSKIPHKEKTKEYIHEHFDQYYKGIRVDNGGYRWSLC